MRGDFADPDIMPLWQAVAARLAQGEDPARIQRVTVALSRAGHAMITGCQSPRIVQTVLCHFGPDLGC